MAASGTRTSQLANEWLGPEHDTTKLLTQGIAVHYGNLPDAIRNAVEEDFRNRRFRVIVATNTLAQGVNLPIRTVVIHSCWRGNSAETMERIPARDYWNIAGRAGRATDETEGTLIHIATTERDEEDFEHYLSRRDNLEPIESALISLFQDLMDQRISETALQERLDPEILAVLAEESGKILHRG